MTRLGAEARPVGSRAQTRSRRAIPQYSQEVKWVGAGKVDRLMAQGRSMQEGEMAGSLPGPSPGQPVGQEEVLLNVIHQGAPHFLHHLEDSLKVVKL